MSAALKDVWVMRTPLGHVHVITEMDKTGGDPLAFGWTVTRETLLTPAQAAVLEAAKAWLAHRHGPRDVAYGAVQRALASSVEALVALEGQP